MAAVTLNIPDHQFQKLQELAATYNLSPEALLTANLDAWLNQPNTFTDAAECVLKKNAELYKRLA